MPQWSPRTLRVTENNFANVDHVHVTVKSQDNLTNYTAGNYPLTSSVTDIPIGSNGLFDSTPPEGTFMNIFVTEVPVEGHGPVGPEQQVPGGPFQLAALVDGAEALLIIV